MNIFFFFISLEYCYFTIPSRTGKSSSPQWFFCDQCSYKSHDKSNFKRHLRCHTEIRPFVCEFCQKSFKLKSNLQEHLRIHTGEKPYECDQCEYKFTSCGSLKHHVLKYHSNSWCAAFLMIHSGLKALKLRLLWLDFWGWQLIPFGGGSNLLIITLYALKSLLSSTVEDLYNTIIKTWDDALYIDANIS